MENKEKSELKEELKKEIVEKIKKEIREDNDSPGGLFIPAGVLAGLGFGFLYNELVAGLFIGLGVGFTLFAIYEIIRVNKD
ncbi:MAG: hypothetical protein ACQEP3_02590 [Patescibacteria group bacterium]